MKAKITRKILWVFLPIILLAVGAKSSYACTCSGTLMLTKIWLVEGKPFTDKGFLDDYDGVVFTGQVIKIEKVKVQRPSGDDWDNYRVTFKVDRYWKGVDSSEVVVFTGAGGGDCGIRFRNGDGYIVFGHMFENRLYTGICTYTAESRYAKNMIRGLYLGEGKHPVQKSKQ